MNEILITNIFFIITGTAVLIVTSLLSIVLFKAFKVLKTIEEFTHLAKKEGEDILMDIKSFREGLGEKDFNFFTLVDFFRKKNKKTVKNK
jgi:hypothetical protein